MYNQRREDLQRAQNGTSRNTNQRLKNYARERHTSIKVNEPAMLMDFMIQKMGGMSRTSVKALLTKRRISVNGKVESQPLNSISHSITFTKDDANIDGDKDMWPFLLGVKVARKDNADTLKTSYNPQFVFQCYAEFFDAEGKELNTGSGDGTNKSSIIFKDYSKESSKSSFEAFENLIVRLNEEEQTYVFFRGKSVLSGEYFFSWSKPKQ